MKPDLTRRRELYFKNIESLQKHYALFTNIQSFLKINPQFEEKKFQLYDQLPAGFHQHHNPLPKLETSVLAWFGLGLGERFLNYIKDHSGHTHIVLEPSLEMFCFALMTQDFTQAFSLKEITWIVGQSLENLPTLFDRCLRSDTIIKLGRQDSNIIQFLGYEEDYFKKAQNLWNAQKTVTNSDTNINPLDEFFGFCHSLKNKETLLKAPLIQKFKNVFRNTPGIVISTGPSLTQSLPYLKGLENKAIIYCADSSYKILRNHGIQPHFVGCFERTLLTKNFFKNVDTQSAHLIATSVVNPETLQAFEGRVIHFLRPQFGLKYFFPQASPSSSVMHSVAHLGLYSLWSMGCSQIYLVGQDLTFDPETQSPHAAGYFLKKEEQAWETILAENHLGKMVPTDFLWLQFSYSLSQLVKRYQIKCTNVIPEKYGIKIPLIPQQNPSHETFDFPPMTHNVAHVISQIVKNMDSQTPMLFEKQRQNALDYLKTNLPRASALLKDMIIHPFDMEHHALKIQSLKQGAWADFMQTFIFGKGLELAKQAQTHSLNNPENHAALLSSWLAYFISLSQLLLAQLETQ